ncbi:transposase of IS30 family protein [Spiroplasma kunkelii CR2-3x]|uniref:Transposase of IS30 family protein n=1 Tax=Spiroplasma kunkelii CR2-3x TaxID=273035 RepID=A0A0K2JI40_SPIKU|nr:transposase of IS30 family protein [Spiroplasma kunkelii CR2-3x]
MFQRIFLILFIYKILFVDLLLFLLYLSYKVYFCDAGTPTQKAKVERINRNIIEYLPKGADFNTVTQKEINKVMKIINEKPRPSLGWLSSREVFLQNINI